MLFELVYISHAVNTLSENDISDILERSDSNNINNNITGMLLYDGASNFIQVLEGGKAAVLNLFERIKQDQRHTNVTLVSEMPILSRGFPKWAMGYKSIKALPDKLESAANVSQFMNTNESLKSGFGVGPELLNHFKQQANL